MTARARMLFALALLAGTSGCSLFGGARKVVLASDPPGATVEVDGRDSGFVTPCVLALDASDPVRVEFLYPGYQSARRVLVPDWRMQALLWEEMYIRSGLWRFPLWLNTKDFFVPIKVRRSLSPNRVHVRLERSADSS